ADAGSPRGTCWLKPARHRKAPRRSSLSRTRADTLARRIWIVVTPEERIRSVRHRRKRAAPRRGIVERATYDLIVIGSGPAGEKGGGEGAYFGKKVALVEEAPSHGGAIANTGLPGKGMRETALYLSGLRQRELHGLSLTYDGTLTVDRFMHRGR